MNWALGAAATGTDLSLAIAFAAGVVSLLSPCVLALLPAYVAYLSGISIAGAAAGASGAVPAGASRAVAPGAPGPAAVGSVGDGRSLGRTGRDSARVVVNALFFVLGFSAIFVAMGATASALGQALLNYRPLLQRLAGVAVIGFGLHTAGLIQLPWLERERRANLAPRRSGAGGSLLIGMAFAAGWSPCVGPVLASILLLAGTSQSIWGGVSLLAAYSAGMALPFLLLAILIARVGAAGAGAGSRNPLLAWFRRNHRSLNLVSGALLVLVGVMLYTDAFVRIAGYFRWTGL